MQRIAVPFACIAIAAAGCGGGGGNSGASASGSTTHSMQATTKQPAKQPAAMHSATVTIKNFDYSPRTLTVARGTTVHWINRDITNHTVTGTGSAHFDLGNVNRGKSLDMRFTTAGTYSYVCQYHPNMHGRIVVR